MRLLKCKVDNKKPESIGLRLNKVRIKHINSIMLWKNNINNWCIILRKKTDYCKSSYIFKDKTKVLIAKLNSYNNF